jgi:GH15 family glucan-1,4-alpha-glucosidase
MNPKEARLLYKSSLKILKGNQHKNGGWYASPPGTRYPYVYARDHSIDILGAISGGLFKQARKGLEFMLEHQKPNGEFAQRYDTDGNDRSYKELQIDGNGLVLFALGDYCEKSGDLSIAGEYWDVVVKGAGYIIQNMNKEVNLVHTINSIHEYPAYEHGFEIYANSACYGGLEAVSRIGMLLDKKTDGIGPAKKRLGAGITKALWSPKRKSFIKNIRIKDKTSKPLGYDPYSSVVTDVDAALYAPAYFGVVEDSDPKMLVTTERIHRELWDMELGGLNRYPESWGRNNGGYGPWPHFTAMLARHYTRTNMKWMANMYLSWIIDKSYEYLLPEHVTTQGRFELWEEEYRNACIMRDDKKVMIDGIRSHPMWETGLAYVVVPLIWPHAEYIMAYNEYKEKYL